MSVTEIKKRKKLGQRCPHCASSQIRHRKFLNTWICQRCHQTFDKPKKDQ